ncbi:MAG: polysaccharide deacetylase family protein [Bacteroidota bacterium]
MKTFLFILTVLFLFSSCKKTDSNKTEAEKLGFEKDKKVLILHADDAGMSLEANDAIAKYMEEGHIQSTAVMAPCPAFESFIDWAKNHSQNDIGMHLTLTSEWKTYRWPSVTDSAKVPGLIDTEGKLWHEVPDVVQHASAEEVETEIRAQIELAKSLGWNPTHIDTHMGTLYGSPEYVKVYLKVAEEYKIPAMVINLSNEKVLEGFRKSGYPLTEEVVEMVANYSMPKLDFFTSVPGGKNYEEVRKNFFKLVKSIDAGLTEIIFHPSTETENVKTITNSWQQRVWEAQLFADPVVKEFFKDEGIVFTNWIEVMERYNKSNS